MNGNAGGSQAHWREGESIAYRTILQGLTAGQTYTLDFHYDTVHSAKHAIDYLTSYDVTETTSTTPTLYHANNINPCSDYLSTSDCVPASPANAYLIPSPSLVSCGGSAGVFGGSVVADRYVKAYGAGTQITNVAYLSQNTVSGTGQCSTSMQVTITAGGPTVILTWGGHIASQADWGFGNSASAISGSPYHMALDLLNGASTGSQDRSLAASAIFFTPTIVTTIYNAATSQPVAGTPPTAPAGTTVYDTATLSAISPVAGGTVYYAFFNNGACTGTPATNESVTVTNTIVPKSPNHGPLSAGSYSFQAYYTGDLQNNVFPAKSACEPLTIVSVTPTITTSVSPSSLTLTTTPVSATDTATVSGGVNPTGTITFKVYKDDTTCSAANLVFTSDPVTVSGDGDYTSNAFTPTAAGTYYWVASYSGDTNNDPVSTACGDSGETLVVNKAVPNVTTQVSTAEISLGDASFTVSDTASLSGGYSPTGTMVFTVYNTASCSGSALFTSTKTVSGNGDYTSDLFTVPGVGTYYWIASYSGDANNKAFATKCGEANEVVHVSPANPTIATVADPSEFTLTTTSTPVHDTATLSGGFTPTGTLTFTLYFDDATCSAGSLVFTSDVLTVTGNGVYTSTPTYTPTAAGTYYWIAAYSGDTDNNAYTTHCGESGEVLTVLPAAPGLTTTATPSSIVLGDGTFTATDTAHLTGGFAPTGTITFNVYNTAGCGGTSLFTSVVAVNGNGDYTSGAFTVPGVGVYYWVASYSGDGNNTPESTVCGESGETLTVTPAQPGVTTSVTPASITLGSNPPYTAFDTATLSGAFSPTGSITFTVYFDDASCTSTPVFTSTVPVSGNGAYPSGTLTVTQAGTYRWIAAYSGDSNNNPFTTTCGESGEVLTVNPAGPSMTTSVSPADVTLTESSTPVTDTATLSGGFSPTGSITFYVYYNDASCGAGNLVFTSSPVTVSGNGDYTSSPAFVPANAGTYYWVASYTGDANNNGFTTACGDSGETLTVHPAQPGITTLVSEAFITLGDGTFTVTDTATLSGAFNPTGSITFTVFSSSGCTGSPLFTNTKTVNGDGAYTSDPFTIPGVGTYRWIAAYSGDSNNNPYTTTCGESGEVVTVSPATPSLSTVASPSSFQLTDTSTPVSDTAFLSGAFSPTGSITFTLYYNDATCGASSLVFTSDPVPVLGNGIYASTPTYTPTAAGTYYWIASYSGDGNNNLQATACNDPNEVVQVLPAAPGLTTLVSPASITLGNGVFTATDTAFLTGAYNPSGSITFTVFNTVGCTGTPVFTSTVPVSGDGDYTSGAFTVPGVGTYFWIASYSGDSNNNPKTTSCGDNGETLTVTPASPLVTTSVTPASITLGSNPPYTAFDTATLSGAFSPTGSITFNVYLDDATCSAGSLVFTSTVPVSGNGQYPSGTLTVSQAGTYRWIASYSGDANNDPFATGCGDANEVLTVSPAPPSMTTLVTPATITLGAAPPYTAFDTAYLSGGFNPSGSITFTVFNTVGCTGTPVFTSTVAVSGNGAYPSDPMTVTATGTYYWIASYTGDGNNNGFTTLCGDPGETLTVSSASPGVTTVVSPSSIVLGPNPPYTATDTATLSGGFNPTGTITFTVYGDALCSGTVLFTSIVSVSSGNGDYTSAPFTVPGVGTYYWIASYSGDSNNDPYASACGESGETLTVTQAPPTVTTALSQESIVLTDATFTVTDTATLSGGFNPTGSITFNVYDTAGCSGSSIFTSVVPVDGNGPYTSGPFTVPGVGTYSWIAAYSGDTNNQPFTTSCGDAHEVLTVTPASPGVTTAVSPSAITLSDGVFTATDTATLSGGFTPTGSITFNVYGDALCATPSLFTSVVSVSGNGDYTSAAFTVPSAGTYYWVADYSGDPNNDPFVSACGANGETLTVTPASPSVTTALTPESIVLGSAPPYTAFDTAYLVGGFEPSGSITFTVFDSAACTGTPLFTDTVPVSGNGAYPSAAFTVPSTGTYYWIASYSGDANNGGFTTGCGDAHEVLTVTSASPTVTTEVAPASIVLTNGPATAADTAFLDGGFNPTGSITFTVFDSQGCAGTPIFTSTVSVAGNGAYTSGTFTVPGVGTYYWVAAYSGDANNEPFTTGCGDANEVLTVTAASPYVTTLVSTSEIVLGDSTFTVTDTATLAGGFEPTGTMTFTVFSTAGCTGSPIFTSTVPVNGNGDYTSAAFTIPAAGTYNWVASYSGDSNNNPFTTTCGENGEVVTVLPASPSVSTAVSSESITLGDSSSFVTDTATLSGGFAPTGSITFNVYDDSSCSGTSLFTSVVSVAGNGPYTSGAFEVPAAGTYYWIAAYSGDGNNNPFTTGCGDDHEVVTVSPAPPTVITFVSAPVVVLHDATFTVTDTAVLSGGFAPTGSITFTVFNNGACTGTPLFTSTVPVSGNGPYTSDAFTIPGVGTYYWIAAYSGDGNNNPFTTSCNDPGEVVTVMPASPGIITQVSRSTITLGDSTFTVTDTATLSDGFEPTGTITFSVYGDPTCSGTVLFTSTKTVTGNGDYTSAAFTIPGAGMYLWIAAYSGDANNDPFTTGCGDANEVVTVFPAPPAVVTQVSAESVTLADGTFTVTDTATLSGGFEPTGTMRFAVYGTADCSGTWLFSSEKTVTGNGDYTSDPFTIPGVGTYSWLAVYSGDLNNVAFSTQCGEAHEVVTVSPASPNVVTQVSDESITLGDASSSVTDTATLSGGFAPTGSMTFTVYGDALCSGTVLFTSTVSVSGNGDYTSDAFTIPGAGTYYWIAHYSGDGNNTPFTTGCGDDHEVVTVSNAPPLVTTEVSSASITLGDGTFTVTDTATLSGGFAPTGSITFTVFNNGACTGTPLFTNTKTVSGNGAYTSDPFTIPGVGTYRWIASYSGDGNNNPFTTGCGDANEVVTVSPASPSVVTAVNPASITLGDHVSTATDTATLSGGFAPTGSITFTVYDNALCGGSALFTSTKAVSGNGDYTSDAFTIPAAGTYYWIAAYSGDGNNDPFTTGCGDANEVITVSPAPPQVTTAVSSESITLSDSSFTVTDTATLSGGFVPKGSITFALFDTAGCTGTPVFTDSVTVNGNGDYTSAAYTITAAGTYSWIAAYSGDANNDPFTTSCGDAHEVVTVSPASPNVVTAVSQESITLGDATFTVTDTATLSGGFAPTGTMTFTVYADASCSGTVLFTSPHTVLGNGDYTSDPFTIPGVGTYYWIAAYSGDANNDPFTTGCGDAHEVVTVAKAPPTVTTVASPATIVLGDSSFTTADTATLSGGFAPTGTMTFTVFANAACTGSPEFTSTKTVDGNGDYTSDSFTVPAAGTYYWIASYSGDGNNNPFTTGCGDANEVVTVQPASPGVVTHVSVASIQLGPGTFTVTDTATLSGGFEPSGSIVFTVFANAACTGSPEFTSTKPVSGNGDVTSDAFTIPGVGTYYWIAAYSGDANNDPFTTGCGDANEVVTVSPAPPNVVTAVSDAAITLHDGTFTVTDTATLSGGFDPTGSITFSVYSTAGCTGSPIFTSTVPVSGNGDYTSDAFTVPGVGTFSWIAAYSGDGNNQPFTTSCGDPNEVVTVSPASPNVVTHVSDESITLGDASFSVTDTATLSGGFAPTGTITFSVFVDALCSGSAVFTSTKPVSGNGDVTSDAYAIPGAGTYYWVAAYSGDSNNDPFTTSCGDAHEVVTVAKAPPTVTTAVSDAAITLGDATFSVTDTATLTGGFEPTGTITFSVYDNAACTGSPKFTSTKTVTANGDYTSDAFTIPGVGTYYWIAAYSGDANNNEFTTGCGDANEVVTVSPASPNVVTELSTESVTLSSSSVTVTDTATLSGGFEPTGTITFSVYVDALCSGTAVFTSTKPVSGNGDVTSAAFTIPGAGTYYWIAAYSGDGNNDPFTTGCGDAHEVLTVSPASPSVTTALSTESFDIPLNSEAVTDTATLSGGFEPTGTITFTVYKDDATCSAASLVFTSDPITVSGNGDYTSSPGFTPTQEGTYRWIAAYSGDTSNTAFTTGCGDAHEVLTVSLSPGTIVVNKVALGGDGLFGYTTTGGSNLPATFSIQTVGGTGTVTYTDMDVHNTYSIAETSMPTGWNLMSVTCSDGSNSLDPTGFEVPAGGTVTCTFTNTRSFGQITDTVFCPFDTDSAVPGQQFNVLFQKFHGAYKIAATNPGQFYYNVFFYGTPGADATITVTLPWPFVTQGSQPVHVYSGFAVSSSGCLQQINDVTSTFTISGPSTTTSGGAAIQLGDYASQANGQTAQITLTGHVPSTGLAYVTVHIMFGVINSTGWMPAGPCSAPCVMDAVNSNGQTLPNNYAYGFGWSEGTTSTSISNTVYNKNIFKN